MMPLNSEPNHHSGGFDAPVFRIEDDHLNRLPLAREVYSVAVNGPDEWSVRIGVYGEWGTGKTSVLKFVAALAEQDKNIVVWFNPWEHDSKVSLWQAFVLKVYEDVEKKLGGITPAGNARRKSFITRMAKLVKPGVALVNDKAAEAADAGLELLKGYFSFGPGDLAELKGLLGERRIPRPHRRS
jgi:predicted KAP-like P-loop ATPase